MTKGSIWQTYKAMKPEEQQFLDRWLKANIALSSVLAVGIIAMAVAGGFASKEDVQFAKSKGNVQQQAVQVPAQSNHAPQVPAHLIIPVSDKR